MHLGVVLGVVKYLSMNSDFSGQLHFAAGVCELPIIFPSPLISKTTGTSKLRIVLSCDLDKLITRDMNSEIEILNDIRPSEIGFKLKSASEIKQSDKTIDLLLTRTGNSVGDVGVTWSINTHLDDKNFMDSQRVTFGPGELEKEISFPLDQSPMKDKNGKYIFSASDLTGDAILSDILGSLAVEVKHDIEWPIVEFSEPHMTHKQSDGNIKIPVARHIAKGYMKVNWHEVGEREFGNEWRKDAGVLEFSDLSGIQHLNLAVCQQPSVAKSTEIELQLDGATDDQEFLLGENRKCFITIIQDVPFPRLSFELPKITVSQSEKTLTVPVIRDGNLKGPISATWAIKSDEDYYAQMHGDLEILDGKTTHNFEIKVGFQIGYFHWLSREPIR